MRLDHVAYAIRDPAATHRFYSEVLGLPLSQAYAGDELMLIYDLPDGGSLVFSARRGETPRRAADETWTRQHVGLTLRSHDDFEAWVHRLERHGVRYQLIEDQRVYFADPDGRVIELEVALPHTTDPDALGKLKDWLRG